MDCTESSRPASTSGSSASACEKQSFHNEAGEKLCLQRVAQPVKSKSMKGHYEGKENGKYCSPCVHAFLPTQQL